MKELNLTAQKREETGKGPNRRLRQNGDVPAIVYGPETEPIAIRVNYRILYRLLHGVPLNTLINLDIEGEDGPARKVIIRELQKDPVSGDLVHIDFHNVAMDKPITVTIPVNLVGIPIGVKTFGGIVEHIQRDVTISCLPAHIPEDVTLDISELSVGESMHVSDLKMENVTIIDEATRTLVTVVAPTVVKSAAEEAAATAEGEAAEGEAVEGEAAEGEAAAEGEEKAEGKDKKEKGEGKDKKEKKEGGEEKGKKKKE
jgi:large subunit ribosomal protein L25